MSWSRNHWLGRTKGIQLALQKWVDIWCEWVSIWDVDYRWRWTWMNTFMINKKRDGERRVCDPMGNGCSQCTCEQIIGSWLVVMRSRAQGRGFLRHRTGCQLPWETWQSETRTTSSSWIPSGPIFHSLFDPSTRSLHLCNKIKWGSREYYTTNLVVKFLN